MDLSRILEKFFGGSRFAAFVLSLLVFYNAIMVGLLLVPAAESGLGRFAQDFRVWCFNSPLDPADGGIDPTYLAAFFAGPILLAGIVVLLWGAGLWRVIRSEPKSLIASISAALVIALGAGSTLVLLNPGEVRGEEAEQYAFPNDAIRTDRLAPDFELINQVGEKFHLRDLRGEVILLTGHYATCHST